MFFPVVSDGVNTATESVIYVILIVANGQKRSLFFLITTDTVVYSY